MLRDRTVTFSGFSGLPENVVIPAGSDSATVSLNVSDLFPGFESDADPTLKIFPLRAVSDLLTASATSSDLFPVALIEAANPVRQLSSQPKNPADLAALDAYFYFRNQIEGVSSGPSRFFDPAAQLSLTEVALGSDPSVHLHPGQDFGFHAAGQVVMGPGTGALNFSTPSARPSLAVYGDQVSLTSSAAWSGLDWIGGIPPAGSLNLSVLNENIPYFFVYNQDETRGPRGYFDAFGDLYESPLKFPVWNDEGGFLAGATSLKFKPATAAGSWMLIAGEDGFRATGLDLDAGGGRVEIESLADLDLKTSRITGTGANTGTDSDPTLRLEAQGTVKVGGTTDGEQVRLEGTTVDTAAGMAPAPGSLAVIRSETALELRNLTIRSFNGTRLEKTGVNSGRILVSGSTVRDFKIKELTGMAVNADAKIQMMAVNDKGQLDGVMQVEGSLPVATKLASAIDTSVTGDLGNKAVHAKDIDLAARRLELNNATLTAMNSLTARANTLIIQNSFMTVVRGTGMINFYVGEGRVNTEWNTTVANQLNFHGSNTFQFGNNSFTIASSGDIASALTSGQMIETTTPQAGKVNVMPLGL